jgi:formylglycine-generating enzyme required for sulfatase activity
MRKIIPIAGWFAIAGVALLGHAASARGQADLKPPADMKPFTETIAGTTVKFEMLPIPGGTLKIGSPDDQEGRGEDEGPEREVMLKPFWMGKHEVTWEEYDQFAFSLELKRRQGGGNGERDKRADAITRPTPPYADETFGYGRKNQPAICITHHAAMEYTRWLSEKTGRIYRLPTEAEWEWAAAAGTDTAYHFGDDASKLDEYAWYVENAEGPMQVGKKKPNPWGLHDMHGNVAEWVLDHYQKNAYATLAEGQATLGPVVLPDEKEYPYIVRGGSWDDDPEALRTTARRASNKEWSIQDPQRPQSIWWHTDATFVGFRLVSPLEEYDNLKGLKSKVISTKKGAK